MKRLMLLVIFIILTLAASIYAFNTRENLHFKTQLANQMFMGNLSLARSGFAVDYSKMNENDKIFYYSQTSSNLYEAMDILRLTSYDNSKNRNDLFEAIYSLYNCMTRSDSRNEILTNKSKTIYNYLIKIGQNPEDQKSCKELAKLAGDLYSHSSQ